MQKTGKRLRLSKLKLSKYYDSGSLVVFYLVSVVWGIDHIIKVTVLGCCVYTLTQSSQHNTTRRLIGE